MTTVWLANRATAVRPKSTRQSICQKRPTPGTFSFSLIFLGLLLTAFPLSVGAHSKPFFESSIPLSFEANEGQVPAEYQFVARHNGMETLYSRRGVDFFIPEAKLKME